MTSIEKIMKEAVMYDSPDIDRIDHFLKVYAFAKMTGEGMLSDWQKEGLKICRQLPRVSKDNLLSELRHRQYGRNRIPPRTGGTT